MALLDTPLGLYYQMFYKHILNYQKVCGLNYVTNPHCKPILKTWCWIFLIIMFFLCTVYTLITYDTETCWKAFSFVGLGFQGLVTYIVLLMHAEELYFAIQFVHRVYKSNTDNKSANYATLWRWSKLSYIIMRIAAVVILSSCAMFLPLNMMENFLSEDRLPILQTFVWGIDENTDVGYMLLYVYHVFTLFLAGVGTCSVDLLFIMFVVHMCPLAEIFNNMFAELNAAVQIPANQKSQELVIYFRNTILMHSEMCIYLDTISNIYSIIIFCEVYTAGFSMCTMIFIILTLDWIELYFLFGLMFSKLFVFCLLGTIVEIATDRVYNTLLESNWYLLPIKEQQKLILMIAQAQQPKLLKAGIAPLNMDTFVSVMKTVYSVGMLLIQSLEE